MRRDRKGSTSGAVSPTIPSGISWRGRHRSQRWFILKQSASLMVKLGMTLESVQKQHVQDNHGIWRDVYSFGLWRDHDESRRKWVARSNRSLAHCRLLWNHERDILLLAYIRVWAKCPCETRDEYREIVTEKELTMHRLMQITLKKCMVSNK